MVVANGVVGVWALGAHRWPALRSKAMWVATAIAQLTIFVQVALGVQLIRGRDTDAYAEHMLYGFTAAFSVAIIYSYRNQLGDKLYLLYGFGGLFIMGLGLRGMVTVP